MDDDEFAELYGTSAVDEPVQRPAAPLANGAAAVAPHHVPKPAPGRDEFEDLYGQSYPEDTPTSAYPTAQHQSHAAAGPAATPFGMPAAMAMQNNVAAMQPLQHQQYQQHQLTPVAAVKKAVAAADDDDDEDFDILVDDDNGPMPTPVAATAAAATTAYPKPPAAPGSTAGPGAAAGPNLTASGRLSSTHLHYVRPGLDVQSSLGSAVLAGQHGQQHHPHMMPQGSQGSAAADRQGSLMGGYGPTPMGLPGSQQYSLPLPGVGMGQQLPGPPPLPGPRPPAAPYPGPPPDTSGAGAVPGPRPPPGAPPELNFIPMGQAGFQIAAAWRDVDAAFPSAAGPHQPIKLPRQHNVDKEEYKEFLNLGHGEIFNLELDRVTTAPWRAAGADISDFFNYGLTEKSWRQYMRQVAKYRAAYTINNKIEILSSDRVEDDLEGLPREITLAVRAWREKHPNKDNRTNNSNNPQQFLPRTRGREYKRAADLSVVLTLVAAEEGAQPEAPPAKQYRRGIRGEYDGPIAGDTAISGVPELPAHTVGPPSPKLEPEIKQQAAGPFAGDQRGLQRLQSPRMQQQFQHGDFQQQQQLLQQRSSASVGLEGLDARQDDAQMSAAAAAAGMAAAGVADVQQAVMRAARGVQVKLAARAPVEEQQQPQQPQQFLDESEMMAEYYNEQLQRQASAGVQLPSKQPDEDDFDFQEQEDGFMQQGVRKRGCDDMFLGPAGGQQQHMEDLDEFDDFTAMGQPQQQQPIGMYLGQMGQNSAVMGIGGFGSGMGMQGLGSGMHGQGMLGDEDTAAAATAGGNWDQDLDDGMPMPQQQQQQGWDMDGVGEQQPQQRQQQQQAFDDGFDGQGGFMGADGYDGDGFDGGWGPGGGGGGGAGPGGPMLGEPPGPDGWGGPMAGGGVPANACFNCGATDHLARNCPHPKHFNITCHNCGELGHRAKDCPAPKRPPPGSDQRCFKCGQEGHIARECPNPPRMGPGGQDRLWGPGPPPPHFGPPQPPPPPRPAADRDRPAAAAADRAGPKPDGDRHFDETGHAGRPGPRPGPGACFRCGQEGHIARECPNPPPSPKGEREGPQPPTCFKCGGEGHYARECTAGRPPRGGEDRWDGGATLDRGPPPPRLGPGACYNCGQEGHIARECTAPPRGAPPPPRGPPPLPPPRSVFDRLGGPGGRGPGPWDGPPPGRVETPAERAAREAEIDRRLRQAEGVDHSARDRDREREGSPGLRSGSGSGRATSSRDRDRDREKQREREREQERVDKEMEREKERVEKEREREKEKEKQRLAAEREKEAAKRNSSRSAAAARDEEERRSSRRGSSRDRKRSRSSRSPERKRDHKKEKSSKRDHSRSLSHSPNRDRDNRRSSKHTSRHRSKSQSKSRSRSRARHRR